MRAHWNFRGVKLPGGACFLFTDLVLACVMCFQGLHVAFIFFGDAKEAELLIVLCVPCSVASERKCH